MVTTLIICMLIYLSLMGLLVYGFDTLDEFKLRDISPATTFSVVIPFRNEERHLPKLLESILTLKYPKPLFEIIFINDHSNDTSAAIIKSFLESNTSSGLNMSLIFNDRYKTTGKKAAITYAINQSNYDWIITTDADCILPEFWLDAFDEYIQIHNPSFISAPLKYINSKTFLERFQALEVLSLQAATIGGFGLKTPFMCNGANLGYRKKDFLQLNGFDGNKTVASGDDIFMLEKFLKHRKNDAHYLNSNTAIVATHPESNFDALFHQRIRWASKSSRSKNWILKVVGAIIFLGNFICLALIPLVLMNFLSSKTAIALFIIKFSIDFLLLFKSSRFFGQERILISYPLSSLLYPIFSTFIALLSQFQSYKWKGRRYKS